MIKYKNVHPYFHVCAGFLSINVQFLFYVGEIDRVLFWLCDCPDPFAVGMAQHWLSNSARSIQQIFRLKNQNINHSNQSTNHSIDQSIKKINSINQPSHIQSSSQSVNQSTKQSINQSINKSINQSINQFNMNQFSHQSTNQRSVIHKIQ